MNKKIKYLSLIIGIIFIEYILINLIMLSYFFKHRKVDGLGNESNNLTYLLLFIFLIFAFLLIKYIYKLVVSLNNK